MRGDRRHTIRIRVLQFGRRRSPRCPICLTGVQKRQFDRPYAYFRQFGQSRPRARGCRSKLGPGRLIRFTTARRMKNLDGARALLRRFRRCDSRAN